MHHFLADIKRRPISRVISFLIVFGFSLFLYISLGYNIKETVIIDGVLIVSINWLPVITHLIITVLIALTLQVFHVKILSLFSSAFKEMFIDIRDELLVPLFTSLKRSIDIKRVRISTSNLLIILFVFILAALQTYTLWYFKGEEVDENALYHFAIGFFGGDFNPNWYGYGSIGMYLLYAVYLVLAVPALIVGRFASIEEYAMQMFYNGYFVLVARYVFACIGIVAVIVYSRLAKKSLIPISLVLLFFIVSVSARDSIFFANYLRTDQLVMFFTALIIYFAANSHKKHNLFFMAISVAGAIAAKISALPLAGILGLYTIYRLYDKTIRFKHVIGISLVFIFFLLAFQPYTDLWDKIYSIFRVGVKGYQSNQTNLYWTYNSGLSERLNQIYNHFVSLASIPVLVSLGFLLFGRKYVRIAIPSVIALFLLVVPYINAATLKYYWFLPAINLVRFLALIGIAGFVYETTRLAGRFINERYVKYIRVFIIGSFWVMAFVYVVNPNVKDYLSQYKWRRTNQQQAQEYVEKNLLQLNPIAIDGHRSQYLPKLYDIKSFDDAKLISRAFMHGRWDNQFINSTFKNYLKSHYVEQLGVDSIHRVTQFHLRNRRDKDYENFLQGKYFITSPFIYRTILTKGDKKSTIYQFYRYILSNPLHKSFEDGEGFPVEIYFITKTKEDNKLLIEERESSNLFDNWIEVDDIGRIDMSSSISVNLSIRLNIYPSGWTTIVSKFESDKNNEFSIRINGRDRGQWYFGDGDKSYVCNFIPEKVLPLGEDVNILAVRDTEKGVLRLFANGKEVASRSFPKGLKAAKTNAPIQLKGNSTRSIDGVIEYLQLFSEPLTPKQMEANIQKLNSGHMANNLVGYWRFDDLNSDSFIDFSGNDLTATIKSK